MKFSHIYFRGKVRKAMASRVGKERFVQLGSDRCQHKINTFFVQPIFTFAPGYGGYPTLIWQARVNIPPEFNVKIKN